MKRLVHSDTTTPGFQIAPMIDVVFVIMLFFMVMVGTVKVEREIGLLLPGIPDFAPKLSFPDNEVTIGVLEDGTITMNDEEFDSPKDRVLPLLTKTLSRLAASSAQQKQNVLVTIEAEEQAPYERVIDVLNSLHKAQIKNVTFGIATHPL
jgi:biopolymer transport protein ExbD